MSPSERLQTQPRMLFDVATSMPSYTSADAWKKKKCGLTFPTFHMGSGLRTCTAPRASLKSPNASSARCCCPSCVHGCVAPPSHFYSPLTQTPERAAFQQAAAAPRSLAFFIAPCGVAMQFLGLLHRPPTPHHFSHSEQITGSLVGLLGSEQRPKVLSHEDQEGGKRTITGTRLAINAQRSLLLK